MQAFEEKDLQSKVGFYKREIKFAYDFYLLRDQKKLAEEVFFAFKKFVEILENKIEQARFGQEEFFACKDQILAIKTGANVPLDYFNKAIELRDFLESNRLDAIFFLSKLSVRYDQFKGAILPFESKQGSISWIFWSELVWEKTGGGYAVFADKQLLFKTNSQGVFTKDYTALMYGITEYNKIESANFRPYRYEDPASYDHKYLLQVIVNWRDRKDFSYFFGTHAYLELKGPDGMVRSVGQDIFDHVRALSIFSINNATNRSSVVSTPDMDCYFTKSKRNRKRITFELTKREYNQIISLVESDKFNHQKTASTLKGNCVSYVCRILKLVLKYEVKADINGLEIFFRNALPKVFDQPLSNISRKLFKLPLWAQKTLFFSPPIILFYFLVGVYGKLTSRGGFKQYTDYKFSDWIFRPWMIMIDLPLELYRVLHAHADESGNVQRSKFPPGTIFD